MVLARSRSWPFKIRYRRTIALSVRREPELIRGKRHLTMMLKMIFASRVRDEWVSCFVVRLDASGSRYLDRARATNCYFMGVSGEGGQGLGRPRRSAKSMELKVILTPLTTESNDQP